MTAVPDRAPMPWPRAALWGALAAGTAMAIMFGLRGAFQVRTLPERVMEWLLLYVPIDEFARGIQTLGPKAKVYALYGSGAVMTLILLSLGTFALRRRWSPLDILALAGALFLVAMTGLVPLTGGGLFGTALPQHPILVNAVYGAVAFAYATVLLAGGATEHVLRGAGATAAARTSRRGLALSAAGTILTTIAAWRQASVRGGGAGSSLPLAQIPASLGATPASAGAPIATSTAVTAATVHPGLEDVPTVLTPEILAAATVPPEAPPEPTAIPTPAVERQFSRDQNGVLTAATRPRGELAPLITPIAAHYVVTKNSVSDPRLDANSWRLVLDGEVNRPVQVDYETLRSLPAVELYKTLECISNFTAMCELAHFGCDLISTSLWKGARLRDVLELAGGLRPGVVSLQVSGVDEYSSSIPAALATDPDTLLVYEMNGQTLPHQHGYPVRLLSPGRYGFKSCKWVVGIRALRTDYVDWYGQRNWSRTGVVRTMSRIDSPFNGARLPPGRHAVSGIAYAGSRGVGAVQLSPNGGRNWVPTAILEPPIGKDVWVRWAAEFDLPPGQTVRLQSRAIDGNGEVQTDVFNLPQPNGGSGRHTIDVTASA